jgi:hypothetical protein
MKGATKMTVETLSKAESNLLNAQKSTGPTSPEGKHRSSQNALKHGHSAKKHVAADHEQAKLDTTITAYHNYYNPQSPFAHACIAECARSQLKLERLAAYEDADLRARIDKHREPDPGEQGIEKLLIEFNRWPPNAVPKLQTTSKGCTWLAARWDELSDALDVDGFFWDDEQKLAFALTMFSQYEDQMAQRPDAWRMAILIYLTALDRHPSDRKAKELLVPAAIPPGHEDMFDPNALPPMDEAKVMLREFVTEQQTRWHDAAQWFQELEAQAAAAKAAAEPVDNPKVALSLFDDEKRTRLCLRYHAEARVSLFRAHDQLLKSLDHDRKHPPAEAKTAPSKESRKAENAVSRNEAKASVTRCLYCVSDESAGSPSGRVETPEVVSHENPLERRC